MSAILIAMSEKNINPNINPEKNERKNGNMSELILDKIRLMLKKDIELKDMLNSVIDSPYKIPTGADMPRINIRLHKEIKIPTFISYAIGSSDISVYGIEIDDDTILIEYNKGNGTKDFESVNLGYRTISIKELFMLFYVLNNLSENDTIEISASIDNHINEIEKEKDLIIEILKDNGIKI